MVNVNKTVWLIQGDGDEGPIWYSDVVEGGWTDDRIEAQIFETEDEAHEFCARSLDGSECVPCGPVFYELQI